MYYQTAKLRSSGHRECQNTCITMIKTRTKMYVWLIYCMSLLYIFSMRSCFTVAVTNLRTQLSDLGS